MSRCRSILFGLLLCLIAGAAQAAPEFPALTGRVVDAANLLSAQTEAQLTQALQQQEQATTNQVVVVTLASLQGYDIADYGYQLGRHWGIGQAGKDNGVLFIIAPKERKTRIEVGYGLEGVLTDALSKQIIDNEVIPHFKSGGFEQGVQSGTQAILAVLGGSYVANTRDTTPSRSTLPNIGHFMFIVIAFYVFGGILRGFASTLQSASTVFLGASIFSWMLANSVMVGLLVGFVALVFHLLNQNGGGGGGYGGGHHRGGGGSWSSGGGGGGFSGGGGSFGGGGASGGW